VIYQMELFKQRWTIRPYTVSKKID